jgi:hypothetical protein
LLTFTSYLLQPRYPYMPQPPAPIQTPYTQPQDVYRHPYLPETMYRNPPYTTVELPPPPPTEPMEGRREAGFNDYYMSQTRVPHPQCKPILSLYLSFKPYHRNSSTSTCQETVYAYMMRRTTSWLKNSLERARTKIFGLRLDSLMAYTADPSRTLPGFNFQTQSDLVPPEGQPDVKWECRTCALCKFCQNSRDSSFLDARNTAFCLFSSFVSESQPMIVLTEARSRKIRRHKSDEPFPLYVFHAWISHTSLWWTLTRYQIGAKDVHQEITVQNV